MNKSLDQCEQINESMLPLNRQYPTYWDWERNGSSDPLILKVEFDVNYQGYFLPKTGKQPLRRELEMFVHPKELLFLSGKPKRVVILI